MQAQTQQQASNTVQGALAAAMKTANDKEIAKNTASATQAAAQPAPLKAIVCRKDILGNALVFDVDSLVKTDAGEFIDFWDGKGTGMKTAPLAYYKVSKPMPMPEAAKLSESYAKAMKLSSVHVRQRLIKDGTLAKDSEGNVNAESIDDFKKRFRAAVDKMLETL